MSNINDLQSPPSDLPLGDNNFIHQLFDGLLNEELLLHSSSYPRWNPVF
jgi:hypothetical protein